MKKRCGTLYGKVLLLFLFSLRCPRCAHTNRTHLKTGPFEKKKTDQSSTATTSDLEENPPVHGDEAFSVLDVYVPSEEQQGEGRDQGGVPQVDLGVLHLESRQPTRHLSPTDFNHTNPCVIHVAAEEGFSTPVMR